MAKKKQGTQLALDEIARSASKRPAIAKPMGGPDPVTAKGTPLRASEWAELEAIAEEHGASVSSLLSFGVRYMLRDYRGGKVKLVKKGVKFLGP